MWWLRRRWHGCAVTDDEFDGLLSQLRRQYGERLPIPGSNETPEELEAREERTRLILERAVLSEVAQERAAARLAPLSREDEDRLVDAITIGVMGLHRIREHFRRPLVEEVRQDGNDLLEVLSADGSIESFPSLVRRPRDLERVIYEIAVAHGRPFNFSHPWVDVSLGDGLRFHGEGFDTVSSPFFTIRRPVALRLTLEDLRDNGSLDDGLYDLLGTAIDARCTVLVVGEMAAGKTTLLRALGLRIRDDDMVATLETDFELSLKRLRGRRVREYQARLPTTTDERGIAVAEFISPALRTRSGWLVIGEIRGVEAAAFADATGVARAVMATVHGRTPAAGLNRVADLLRRAERQMSVDQARHEIYGKVDLVVQVVGDASRGRWVGEVIAPFTTDDGVRVGWHTVYGRVATAPDERARPVSGPQEWLVARLRDADPGWQPRAWQARVDTYRPLRRASEQPLRRVV